MSNYTITTVNVLVVNITTHNEEYTVINITTKCEGGMVKVFHFQAQIKYFYIKSLEKVVIKEKYYIFVINISI